MLDLRRQYGGKRNEKTLYLGTGEYRRLVVNRIGPGSETENFHRSGGFYLEMATEEAYTILIEGLY
jgi:hypothetical protein